METRAWAAGLFDGEGTATVCRGRPRLAVQMCDEAVVRRFHGAVGVGRVYGPYSTQQRDGHRRKPRWVWLVEGDALFDAVVFLSPFLSAAKGAAIERALG